MKCKECGGNRTKEKCNLCELFATGGSVARTQQTTTWPMVCEALAVHPKQIEQANERAKKHGINVTYGKHGLCHIPDPGNYKKLLRLERMHNNSEGYHGC